MTRLTHSRDIPPPLELACLKALWSLQEANVKAVREALVPDKPLAYTTVMTLLDRLVRKGGASRRKVGRAFVYRPVLDRESLRRAAVRQLTDCFFDGSPEALVSYLKPESQPHTHQAEDPRLDPVLL